MDNDSKFSYFFLGVGLGAAAALLFAPTSGEEARSFIRSRTEEGRDYLKQRSDDLTASANDMLERGKSAVTRQRDTLAAAVEAGKQAYREAVNEAGLGSVNQAG